MTAEMIDLSAARAQRQGADAMATEVRLIIRQYELLDQAAERVLAVLDAHTAALEAMRTALDAEAVR